MRLGDLLAQLAAVSDLAHVPSGGGEQRLPLPGPADRHDPVQRLAVVVDDPEDVPQPGRGGLGNRLPDASLVQLRVAHQRDEPARLPGAEVVVDVPAGQRREQRGDGAQSQRPGGEVDTVRVAGPARVRLQPTAGPQPRQIAAVQPTEQVLDRVEHRGGMRLDADLVAAAEVGEVQRGHRRDQAGAARLMPPDPDPVTGVAVPVRGVDHPDGEPQHPAGDLLEHVRVRLTGAWVAQARDTPRGRPAAPLSTTAARPRPSGRGLAAGRRVDQVKTVVKASLSSRAW